MAVSREKESLAKVLAHEGGYSNNKKDPGGPTMKGVTQRVYDAYRKGKGQATRSVKSISTDELNEIYDRQYWDAVKGDLLPDGVDYVLFDGAVNSGPGRSIMFLQQALRPVYTGNIDGVMGMGTITALKAINNNDALIDRICDARMNFLRHLGTFAVFGKGWSARVKEVRSIGKAWATGEAPQAANFIEAGRQRRSCRTRRLRRRPRRLMPPSAPGAVASVCLVRSKAFRNSSRRCPTPASGLPRLSSSSHWLALCC
ncbi:glycoside hydrolase family 108 protein [Mesorhizobium sp. C089B]|uniref:glycoside hydrolase family 108 protein n=1 Tax=Mesorhizobium sp. C089B TaxID=2956823 RepID=UPI0025777A81|nr:glycoside hydrolase family 108 protein [Mesorhizobium sp. C089B]WJI52580.1 glycoside hydrolase family 108 protein [Mesorhizobium sp. C089B]